MARARLVTFAARLMLVAGPLAVVSACRKDAVSSAPPVTVQPVVSTVTEATVNTTLAPAPGFVVKDADGNVLGDVAVTIAVLEGGGTLSNAPARSVRGTTSVGQWKLGTRAGRNALSVTVGSLLPLIIEAIGRPDVPVALVAGAGNAQVGVAGARLPTAVGAKAVDQFGNGVQGVPVNYTVSKGQGSASPLLVTTGADGVAGSVTWTLGKVAGTQELAAVSQLLAVRLTATARSDFDIDLRFYGTAPAANVEATFRAAVDRVRAAVVGDISELTLTNFDVGRCGVQPPATLNEVVDDVIIYASVTAIDGPGNILGSAGPCLVRASSRFTVIGVMRFDVDDINSLASTGRLDYVILHEMLHVVGVGTIWRSKGLLQDPGTADPRYTGPSGMAKCVESGGAAVCGTGVPVENVGAAGSVDSHWRESVFDTELMTSRAEASGISVPFSAMTIASLQDYGYEVNLFAADPFTVPVAIGSPRLRADQPGPPWEELQPPQFEVDASGRVSSVRFR